jgi:succinate dehydrogenase/fumarate reductase cytochrome b subunit
MRSPRVFYHRYISWVLVVVSVSTIVTGYTLSRGWQPDFVILSYLHRVSEIVFIGLIIAHIGYTLLYFKLSLRKTAGKISWYKKNSLFLMRIIQRVSSWVIVFAAMGMILTGLNGYSFFAQSLEDVIPFAPHRVFDVLLVTAVIVHVVIGIRFALMRRRVRNTVAKRFTIALAISLLFLVSVLNPPIPVSGNGAQYPSSAQVTVDSNEYSFKPADVETTRPDIFLPDSFSMFDVLVHLDTLGDIELVYHFNESMNTHVIDLINGKPNWWYRAKYSGGWNEDNVYRMDHYIWKPGTTLEIVRTSEDRLDRVYSTYLDEVERTRSSNGTFILPVIRIRGLTFNLEFRDVPVTPHDLRSETLQPGVLTAIDVILSLGDLGLINYTLQWYDDMGLATVVRSYWVESINEDTTAGTCGFVYDTGSTEFLGFAGNHIHLPADVNVLNSPDYMRWFWICV